MVRGTVRFMTGPACHYCEESAQAECATCGRLYCHEHGDDVCLRCMAPESAAPGAFAYRGSLVALGLASLVAVFLIANPPQDSATGDEPGPAVTDTPTPDTLATPTPADTGDEVRPTTTIVTPVPDEPTPAATPGNGDDDQAGDENTAASTTYTVEEGDTLTSIADAYDVDVDEILAVNDDLGEDDAIVEGQDIIIPSP